MKHISKVFAVTVLAMPLLAVAQPVAPRQHTTTLHDRAPRLHDRTLTLRVSR